MSKIRNKLLGLFASSLFVIAIQAVNSVSRFHSYQEKEPASLKKYEKI